MAAEPDMNAVLRDQLGVAQAALADGDAAGAERQAKAISALVRAARDLAELESLARAEEPEEDVEALRAEFRRRIALFVAADQAGASDEQLVRIAREGVGE